MHEKGADNSLFHTSQVCSRNRQADFRPIRAENAITGGGTLLVTGTSLSTREARRPKIGNKLQKTDIHKTKQSKTEKDKTNQNKNSY